MAHITLKQVANEIQYLDHAEIEDLDLLERSLSLIDSEYAVALLDERKCHQATSGIAPEDLLCLHPVAGRTAAEKKLTVQLLAQALVSGVITVGALQLRGEQFVKDCTAMRVSKIRSKHLAAAVTAFMQAREVAANENLPTLLGSKLQQIDTMLGRDWLRNLALQIPDVAANAGQPEVALSSNTTTNTQLAVDYHNAISQQCVSTWTWGLGGYDFGQKRPRKIEPGTTPELELAGACEALMAYTPRAVANFEASESMRDLWGKPDQVEYARWLRYAYFLTVDYRLSKLKEIDGAAHLIDVLRNDRTRFL